MTDFRRENEMVSSVTRGESLNTFTTEGDPWAELEYYFQLAAEARYASDVLCGMDSK